MSFIEKTKLAYSFWGLKGTLLFWAPPFFLCLAVFSMWMHDRSKKK